MKSWQPDLADSSSQNFLVFSADPKYSSVALTVWNTSLDVHQHYTMSPLPVQNEITMTQRTWRNKYYKKNCVHFVGFLHLAGNFFQYSNIYYIQQPFQPGIWTISVQKTRLSAGHAGSIIGILWSSATGVFVRINYELAVKCLLPTHVSWL